MTAPVRLVSLALVGALVSVTAWAYGGLPFPGRFSVQTVASGVVVKLDTWTGRSWTVNADELYDRQEVLLWPGHLEQLWNETMADTGYKEADPARQQKLKAVFFESVMEKSDWYKLNTSIQQQRVKRDFFKVEAGPNWREVRQP